MLTVKASVGELLPKGCLKNWAGEGRAFQGEGPRRKVGVGGIWGADIDGRRDAMRDAMASQRAGQEGFTQGL